MKKFIEKVMGIRQSRYAGKNVKNILSKEITEIENTEIKAEYMIMDIYFNMFPGYTFFNTNHAYEKIIEKIKQGEKNEEITND
jgi:hypothetical protein